MALRFQVTFDCADPQALAGFWAAALGYALEHPPAGYETWHAYLRDTGKTGQEPPPSRCRRRRSRRAAHVTMQDPEGNEFCLR